MNAIIRTLASGAACAAIALSGATAAAASPSPIRITKCTAASPLAFHKTVNGVRVQFVNVSRRTVQRVRIRMVYHQAVRTVADQGIFTPGVQINHSYNAMNDLAYNGGTLSSCRVTFAAYDNGGTWQP